MENDEAIDEWLNTDRKQLSQEETEDLVCNLSDDYCKQVPKRLSRAEPLS